MGRYLLLIALLLPAGSDPVATVPPPKSWDSFTMLVWLGASYGMLKFYSSF